MRASFNIDSHFGRQVRREAWTRRSIWLIGSTRRFLLPIPPPQAPSVRLGTTIPGVSRGFRRASHPIHCVKVVAVSTTSRPADHASRTTSLMF